MNLFAIHSATVFPTAAAPTMAVPKRGYSRLTDGDPNTFWKSNPYLTKAFTHDDDSLHPQWIIVDLDEYYDVNAIRIDWCEPRASEYEVQYWVGADPMNWEEPAMDSTDQGGEYLPVANQAMGNWIRFPNGVVRDGKGGSVTLKLADNLISTRWVRVVMTQSSNQPGPHGSDDLRHRVGYAIYEVYVGRLEADGKFADFVKHAANGRQQTATYCSSTDPWHTVQDLNPRGDQTGWDIFFTSGITNGSTRSDNRSADLQRSRRRRRHGRLFEKARLSHQLGRNGRRSRWAILHA